MSMGLKDGGDNFCFEPFAAAGSAPGRDVSVYLP